MPTVGTPEARAAYLGATRIELDVAVGTEGPARPALVARTILLAFT